MSDVFEEREKGFEAKFKLDQERTFKAKARRNKLVGQWAGERLGLSDAETEDFTKAVIRTDLKSPGDDDVIQMLLDEFASHNIQVGIRYAL